MKTLRIATRKSPLALWQAEHVAGLLQGTGVSSELVPLVSGGDADMRPIDGTRQVGLFTKRIQQAVIDHEADIAVHSLKDLPTEVDNRLALAAVPEREAVQDCLVSAAGWKLAELPESARVGTGSRRRGSQLLSLRGDLQIEPIRGNVQTRLEKLAAGEFDAIMLAQAGILRLQMHDLSRITLSLDEMLPAPGQGALGIEVRSDDQESLAALAALDHCSTRASVTAERQLLAALHGGCLAPIAAFAEVSDQTLRIRAVVLSTDGTERIDEQHQVAFDPSRWEQAASELAAHVTAALVNRGANRLIQDQRSS
jgi:hydroxymethylbilane synthase